jgi:hypothetical protein
LGQLILLVARSEISWALGFFLLAGVAQAVYDRHMPAEDAKTIHTRGIGLLRETSLHAALKAWYAQEGDRFEVLVDGYVIDIVRAGRLIEIQTRNFSSLKVKLFRLTRDYPVCLVYPIAQEKWLVRISADGQTRLTRRRSPRHGRVEHLFKELVRFPALVKDPNFSIEVLLTQEEEVWQDDGKGSWRRRGWSIADRRLLGVVDRLALTGPQDFQVLLPPGLPNPFTTQALAQALEIPRSLAQKMVYCLREMEVLGIVGKQGKAWLYTPQE